MLVPHEGIYHCHPDYINSILKDKSLLLQTFSSLTCCCVDRTKTGSKISPRLAPVKNRQEKKAKHASLHKYNHVNTYLCDLNVPLHTAEGNPNKNSLALGFTFCSVNQLLYWSLRFICIHTLTTMIL